MVGKRTGNAMALAFVRYCDEFQKEKVRELGIASADNLTPAEFAEIDKRAADAVRLEFGHSLNELI